MTTYETNAAPMPTVMLNVSGMRMSPRRAGKPSSSELKSMSLMRLTIRKPTNTRTGPVATYGTTTASGVSRIAARKSRPVTTEVKPGAATLGDARRALDVARVRADARRATERQRRRSRRAGCARRPRDWPSSSTRPACSLIAVAVPIVSKKSVSMKLKIVSTAARTPRTVNTLVTSNAPSVEKSGVATKFVGMGWTPVRIATIVVMRMLSRSAAGILRAHRTTVTSRPNQNTKSAGCGREHEHRRDAGSRPRCRRS